MVDIKIILIQYTPVMCNTRERGINSERYYYNTATVVGRKEGWRILWNFPTKTVEGPC